MNKILTVKSASGDILMVIPDGKGGVIYRTLDGEQYNKVCENLDVYCPCEINSGGGNNSGDFCRFKTLDVVNNTITVNNSGHSISNFDVEVGGNITLEVPNKCRCTLFRLVIKKLTPNDLIITLPENSIVLGYHGSTNIVLSGAEDEYFLIEFSCRGDKYIFNSIVGEKTVTPIAECSCDQFLIKGYVGSAPPPTDINDTLIYQRIEYQGTDKILLLANMDETGVETILRTTVIN